MLGLHSIQACSCGAVKKREVSKDTSAWRERLAQWCQPNPVAECPRLPGSRANRYDVIGDVPCAHFVSPRPLNFHLCSAFRGALTQRLRPSSGAPQ